MKRERVCVRERDREGEGGRERQRETERALPSRPREPWQVSSTSTIQTAGPLATWPRSTCRRDRSAIQTAGVTRLSPRLVTEHRCRDTGPGGPCGCSGTH